MRSAFTKTELIILLVVLFITTIVLYPMFPHTGREKARQTTCTSNQKQICTQIAMYIQENDGKFPTIDENIFQTIGLSGKVLNCPNTTGQGYVVNARLSKLKLDDIANPFSVWLSADAAKNADGPVGYGSVDMNPRHNGGIIAGYADSHVAYEKNINKVAGNFFFEMDKKDSGNVKYDAKDGFVILSNKPTAFKLLPAEGYKTISATTSKKTEVSWSNDGKSTRKIKKEPNIKDLLYPGMSYTIIINDLVINAKSRDEIVTIAVQFCLAYNISGGDKVYNSKPVGKPYVEKIKDITSNKVLNIKTIPLYVAPPFDELKKVVNDKDIDIGNPVLYPVVEFTASKAGTQINFSSINVVTMGY